MAIFLAIYTIFMPHLQLNSLNMKPKHNNFNFLAL